MKKPFLLSPAGSMSALYAAVKAGADEVYLGGSAFNARAGAVNFNNNQLIQAGAYCRENGVRLLVTLNTLLFNRELATAVEFVDFLQSEVGVHALIVQDMGLARLLKQKYPSLILHASTQARVRSADSIEFLKEMGFNRAVIAREADKNQIELFAKSGLESEIFIHGAICVCESGGCLMSSVIGGRSGNRGECAQPCRLPYDGKNGYPLSLKDMCLASHIPEIIKSGVTALKIEGRMKSPAYVYAVTSVYRRLLDENRAALPKEIEFLSDLFSRSGFTDGYFTKKLGLDMFGTRTASDKKRSALVEPSVVIKETDYTRINYTPISAQPQMPTRDETLVIPAREQKGMVLRFEGELLPFEKLIMLAETAARVDIPLWKITEFKEKSRLFEKVSVIIPRIYSEDERTEIISLLKKAKELGVTQATVNAVTPLTKGFFLHGDIFLNVANKETAQVFCDYSLSSIMISPEANANSFAGTKAALECVGYGRLPLMHTENCIISNVNGGCGKGCSAVLRDRTNASFPIIRSFGHRSTIYNSKPSFRLDKRGELKKAGVGLLTLLFTTETPQEINKIISLYQTGEKPDFEFTRR